MTNDSAATNSKKWTFSTWVKLGKKASSNQTIVSAGTSSGPYTQIKITSDDRLQVYSSNSFGGSGATNLKSSRRLYDSAAWYHFVVAFDSTEGTQSNRLKMWINNEQVTDFSTNTNAIALNEDNDTMGANAKLQVVGRFVDSDSEYFGGTLSQTAFVDGSALTPSSFGQTNTATGVWKVKSAGATWGNNGWLLQYEDSGASAAVDNFGSDSSGNGNHFASNNLGSHPNTQNTPENSFCQWNKITQRGGSVSANGLTETTDDNNSILGNIVMPSGSTSKYYWEIKVSAGNNNAVGIAPASQSFRCSTTFGINDFNIAWYGADGRVFNFGTTSQGADGGRTFGAGDILGFRCDMNGGSVDMYKNGSSIGSAEGWNTTTYPNMVIMVRKGGSSNTTILNAGCPDFTITGNSGNGYSDAAGYGKFQYAVPTGYYALCTANVAAYGG